MAPPKDRDDGLDRELRFHLEELVEAHLAAGATREEALRQARLDLGGMEQAKEACRDVRRMGWLHDVGRDLRLALRLLRRSPVFTVVAVATLALGTGAHTAVFSLVHQVLLRPLPVDRPQGLVALVRTNRETSGLVTFPHPFCRELQEERQVLEGALCRGGTERVPLGTEGGAEPLAGELVSGTYFEVLGLKPHVGRLLTRLDDVTPGGHPVVVLSHRFWLRRFGGDPGVVGTQVRLSGHAMTVVGVSPPGFDGLDPGQSVDVRVPLAMQAEIRRAGSSLHRRDAFELNVVARLRPGVSLPQAQEVLSARLASYLEPLRFEDPPRLELRPAVTGFGRTRAQLETALWVLFGLTTAVLLVACLNLGSLLLTRACARRRELSVRVALGAGAGRIARQLLTESLLLAACGATLGLGVAFLGGGFLAQVASGGASRVSLEFRPGVAILLFHLGVALAAGLVFGLAPALQGRRLDVLSGLKAGPAEAPDLQLGGRRTLVIGQVALSTLVLVAAGLFTRSVIALRATDLGFRPEGLLLVALDPKTAGRPDGEVLGFFREVRERVEALPGVEAVSFAAARALSGSSWRAPVVAEGSRAPASSGPASAARNAVGPAYFRTLGIPVLSGRDFSLADGADAPKVAVINETFARIHFDDEDPLGRRVGQDALQYTIVGVVKDTRSESVREPSPPRWYVPYEQRPGTKHLDLCVRTALAPEDLTEAVRRAVASVDPRVAFFEVRSQEAQLELALGVESMLAGLAAGFGASAVALSALGLYGVLGLVVAERRREIALRIAVGARPADVVRDVAGRAARWVTIGLLVGLVLSAGATQGLRALLYGVAPLDALSLWVAIAIVVSTAAAAALLPVRRAASLDALTVLREL